MSWIPNSLQQLHQSLTINKLDGRSRESSCKGNTTVVAFCQEYSILVADRKSVSLMHRICDATLVANNLPGLSGVKNFVDIQLART
jgi:hypothetical protein